MNAIKRTSAKKKAKELAKYLRAEHPDYAYLKSVFQHLRSKLEVEVSRLPSGCHMYRPNTELSVITRQYGKQKTSRG